MVSWLDRGKTFAVYEKQIKNEIQNKQTEKPKHCPAAIMSSCKTLRLSSMSWMSSSFQRKRCKKKKPTCRVTKDRHKKNSSI